MRTIRFLTCAALLCGAAGISLAAQNTPQEKPTTTTVQVQKLKLTRVSDLVAKDVATARGEALGKVEEVIVHPRGDVAFVVLSTAGHLNFEGGKNLIPVPWRAMKTNEDGSLVLDIKVDSFEHQKSFNRNEWPKLSDMDYWKEIDGNFNKQKKETASPVEASASLAPTKLLFRSSELKSRHVESPEGEQIATIHEIVVDPQVGRISYVVLSVGGFLGTGEKLIAVPWDAIKIMPSKDNPKLERLTLATTKEKLEKAPEYMATSEGWTKASEPDYVLRVYEYYAVPPYWAPSSK